MDIEYRIYWRGFTPVKDFTLLYPEVFSLPPGAYNYRFNL